MAYPNYKDVVLLVSELPIRHRSLLIKLCQAQVLPSEFPSTLQSLLDDLPPVLMRSGSHKAYTTLREALQELDSDLQDPLTSAIILDIARGVTAAADEVYEIKQESWAKEVALSGGTHVDHGVNWDVFFGTEGNCREQLHANIPANPTMARTIRRDFHRFRERIRGTTLFSRYTHKNMPYSTRREYELMTGESLEQIPIFGQDDWVRYYHRTGHQLGGATEMRQRWYTSGAKPRTYFAMGGEAYGASRFLQGFFSDLVDSFPPTNHKLRLRTGRLTMPHSDEEIHWRIYDLSSFTSNCSVQRSFCYRLASFFSGVEVTCYDERYGPMAVDMGDLLQDYVSVCVERPSLSLERFDPDLVDFEFCHMVASMLGIFGNLMTCTSSHFLITSPFVSSYSEVNCAGDDEIIPEESTNTYALDQGIQIVGVYERTKSFRGNEEGAIQLKRPFLETLPNPTLLENIIPPTVATVLLLLDKNYRDLRFRKFPSDDMTWKDNISVVGKDLMRFLMSAWRMKYADVEKLHGVYRGFCKLVRELTGYYPVPALRTSRDSKPYWPIDPFDYEFCAMYSPMDVLVTFDAPKQTEVPVLRLITYWDEGIFADDSWECNQNPRLKLLETLGYIEKEEVMEPVPVVNQLHFWCDYYSRSSVVPPTLYKYTVISDIPYQFHL